MKNLAILLLISGCVYFSACKKEIQSEKFILLTGSVWQSDSLLANGIDASGSGGFLENFKGEAKFNEDGTGTFGSYTGTWSFLYEETYIKITAESLPVPGPLNVEIAELTGNSLKITTSYPTVPPITIRMTFKPK